MAAQLTRQGDDFYLKLDRATVERLGLTTEAPLDAAIEGDRLIVRQPKARREVLRDAAKAMDAQYGGMMKRLAE